MTEEYKQEYSEQIKFHGWAAEWRLDTDEEDQLEADIAGEKALLEFLQRRKQVGTKSSPAEIEKPGNLIRRRTIRE